MHPPSESQFASLRRRVGVIVRQWSHCALRRDDVSLLACRERDLELLLEVEIVILGVHCIREVVDVPLGVQRLPGAHAYATFARLEREDECVQARGEFRDVVPRDSPISTVEVGVLVRVRLFASNGEPEREGCEIKGRFT